MRAFRAGVATSGTGNTLDIDGATIDVGPSVYRSERKVHGKL